MHKFDFHHNDHNGLDFGHGHRFTIGEQALGVGIAGAVLLFGGLACTRPAHTTVHRTGISTQQVAHVHHVSKLVNHTSLLSLHPHTMGGSPVQAQSALTMDLTTGQVTYAKRPNQQRDVASLAKLMGLYLVARKAERTDEWNHVVPQANQSSLRRMGNDTKSGTGGVFRFKRGQRYTVSELYQAALVGSSNNAMVALGEWCTGNNASFVRLENEQARAWHLKARFVSSSGLENDDIAKYGLRVTGGKHTGNHLSAVDIAKISAHLLHDFPQVTRWSKLPSDNVKGQIMGNVNANLPGQNHAVPGDDGLKAGFTLSSGYCFAGTRKLSNGHRILSIVLNDPQEFSDEAKLMK